MKYSPVFLFLFSVVFHPTTWAEPHILGSDSSAQDISQYASTIFKRFDDAFKNTQSTVQRSPDFDIDAILNGASFPLLSQPITLQHNPDLPIESITHKHPSGKSFCVIGTDDYSLHWLSKLVQSRSDIKQCFLIEVENADLLRQWMTSIRSVRLIPLQGATLAEQFQVPHYPIMLNHAGAQ